MDIVDFLIHLRHGLSDVQRMRLETELGDLEGVISAHFDHSNPHVIEVAYNPAAITSSKVMELVDSHGIIADKVGL